MTRKAPKVGHEDKVRSKEMLLLQDVWREAYRRGGATIPFPSEAGAVRARMQLYNAVKLQKTGQDLRDMELVHAAEQLEIVWVDRVTLRLQLRARSDMMVGLQSFVGKRLEDFVEPDALESSERMLKELEKQGLAPSGPTPVPTPSAEGEDDRLKLATEHKPNPWFDRTKGD